MSAVAVLSWSGALAAQGNPESGDVAPPPGQFGGQVQGGGQIQGGWQPAPMPAPMDPNAGAMPPPDPTAAAEPEAPPGSSDHSQFVGHFGVGFFGVMSLPTVGCDGPACGMSNVDATLPAPTIGARYWMSEGLGIEAALGLNITSSDNGGFERSAFGFALHGGVPLALLHTGSFVFEVVPQINFGITSGSYEVTMPLAQKADVSGLLIGVGVEAGAEIHFGFIGLPQLSLQGTIGLMLQSVSRSLETMPPGTTVITESEASEFSLRTTLSNAPWQLFTETITAIYYF